jgi:CotH kinase protein
MRKSLLSAFCVAWLLAPISAQVLFNGQVNDFTIRFAQDGWEKRLDSFKQADANSRLEAQVLIGSVGYPGAKVKYKGNSSYYNVRNTGSFKLPFNIKSPKDSLFDGSFEVVKLSNNFRDPSQIREVLGYELARRYMYSSRSGFVHLRVNEQDYGLYTITEPVEQPQVEAWTKVKGGHIFKCDPAWNTEAPTDCPNAEKASLNYIGEKVNCYTAIYETEGGYDLKPLIKLMKVLDQTPDKAPEVLAIDETLWMLAFDQYTVNLDSYLGKLSHNYYLYCDSFGGCMPIIWDLNLAFGGFAYDGITPTALNTKQLTELSPLLHFDNPKRPLVSKLLKKPLYRKMYVAHLKLMVDESIQDQWLEKRAQELSKSVAPTIATDPMAFYGKQAFEQNLDQPVLIGKNEIPGLIALIRGRSVFLKSHPLLQKAAPKLTNVEHKIAADRLTISGLSQEATQVYAFVKRPGHLVWEEFLLNPSTNGTWSIELPHIPETKYFLVAETPDAVACFPARSSKEAVVVK